MQEVVDLARRVAKVNSTVLITGESGLRKERLARLIHDQSARAAAPFVALRCGAIVEALLDGELFGHACSAFVGAIQDRLGLFETANGGTLLLEEVGELSPGMQVKLLQVLEKREVRRVGEDESRPVDVRVVATSKRDLAAGVKSGLFRQDLYYCLKVVELRVPPIRERTEDVLPLARALLADAAQWMKRKRSGLTPDAADQLLRYEWPGNEREIESAMERAITRAGGRRVEIEDLPEEIRRACAKPTVGPGGVQPLAEIAKDYILAALEANDGNQTRTAAQLKIGSATLYRKLKSYGVIGAGRAGRNGAPRKR